MHNTINLTTAWFEVALPAPTSKNLHTQLGVHFEEVAEMVASLKGTDRLTQSMLTAALVIVVMLLFDLSGIAMMGSAAFLLIYAAVNAGHLRVLKQTGANAVIVWLSLLTCLAMFAILGVYTWQQQPAAIAALLLIGLASFVGEWLYRRWTGHRIKLP